MDKLINTVFYGHGPWASNTLKKLLKRKDLKVNLVVSRFPSGDKDIESICKIYSKQYVLVENINEYFVRKNLFFDLGISVSYDQIFKSNTIISHKKALINCHAGNLPDFKGRNIINWAIINNLKEFGITVHFVNEGIDTGDIILQKLIEIKDNDDYKDLLLKAYKVCPELVINSLDIILKNKFNGIPQNKIKKFPIYCSRRREGDEIINWNNTSLEIFNFIRALVYPGPYAQTFINGVRVYIKKAEYIKEAPVYKDCPGSILKKENSVLTVKTGDSYIFIKEWDCDILLKIGDRFNSGFNHC
tara:strand:- start:1350 stop:2255 length:906 start_codon:yes stop_codon:yes gene_type:complete